MDQELRRALEDLSYDKAAPFNPEAEAESAKESQAALIPDQPQGDGGTSTPPGDTPDPTKTDNSPEKTGSEVVELKETQKIKFGDAEFSAADLKSFLTDRTSFERKQAELIEKDKSLEAKAAQLSSSFEFLDLAAKSKVIAPALQALRNGATEDQALAMMLVGAGLDPAKLAKVPEPPTPPDPRSVWPPEGIDPNTTEYEKAYVAHLEYQLDQRNEKLRTELIAEIAKRDQAELDKEHAHAAKVAEARAVLTANQELIRQQLVPELPFKIEELSTEQVAQFMAHIADTGKQLGIPLDEATLTSRNLTAGELKYVALKAYPSGVNPFKEPEPPKPEPPAKDPGLQPGEISGSGSRTQPSFLPEGYNPDGYRVLLDLKPM